jgi:hypothetical protein
MEKDKEIELKVQMFCAAIKACDKSHLFYMRRVAEGVNGAFEELKNPDL